VWYVILVNLLDVVVVCKEAARCANKDCRHLLQAWLHAYYAQLECIPGNYMPLNVGHVTRVIQGDIGTIVGMGLGVLAFAMIASLVLIAIPIQYPSAVIAHITPSSQIQPKHFAIRVL
jgi:hypothetical protein